MCHQEVGWAPHRLNVFVSARVNRHSGLPRQRSKHGVERVANGGVGAASVQRCLGSSLITLKKSSTVQAGRV
jgi:hypothetical protein